MKKMGRHFQRALKLLAAGNLDATEALLDVLDDEIGSLEDDRDLIKDMVDHARGPAPKSKAKAKKLRKIPDGERSELIKKYAEGVATGNSGKASIADVARAIEADGLDLGTSIPGTVIANVLFKSDRWERVEKGIFRYLA